MLDVIGIRDDGVSIVDMFQVGWCQGKCCPWDMLDWMTSASDGGDRAEELVC